MRRRPGPANFRLELGPIDSSPLRTPGVVFVRIVLRHRLRSVLPALAVTLVVATGSKRARASAWDVFGFGPEGIASVSARSATATDGSATFYNPAGLGFGRGLRLELSGLAAMPLLHAQGSNQTLQDPVGGCAAIDADVPLEGPLSDRVRVGLGLYALPSKLMRIELRKGTDPFFPYYDNRTQRLAAIPALAVRPASWLGLGVGANVLGGVSGPVDVREGQSRGLETLIEQDVNTVVSWVAGVRVDPLQQLHVALTYRQAFGVPFHVTTTANVAGVPLMVDVNASQALYDPASLVLGTAAEPTARLRLEVNASWQRWSVWQGPLLGIDTTVSALSLSSHLPQGLFRDTWSVRGAGRWWVSRNANGEVGLLAGLGYETSMLVPSAQQGGTNFVDGAKVLVGGGATARFPGLVGRAFLASIGAQLQRVSSYAQAKRACTSVPCAAGTVVGPDTDHPSEGIGNPGYPTLSGGGAVFVLSAGLGVEL